MISSAQRVASERERVELFIEPDTAAFSSLQFEAFDELVRRGYEAAHDPAVDLRRRLEQRGFLL